MTASGERLCFECGGPMEVGFLLDVTHGGRIAGQWVAGEPEKSIWTGTKISGRAVYEVAAFRCTQCGSLRTYATKRKK